MTILMCHFLWVQTLLETFAICSRSRSFADMQLIFYLHLLMQMENMMMNGLADFEA